MSSGTTYDDLKEFMDEGNTKTLDHPTFASGIIHISFKSTLLLAESLDTNPQALSTCKALFIESPDIEDMNEDDCFEQEDGWSQKCAALVKVLDAFVVYGCLRSFTWIWEEGWMEYGQPGIPSEVYEALARNGASLESLNIDIPCAEFGVCYPSWGSFPLDQYTSLRRLRLGLNRAYCGEGGPLRRWLMGLSALQCLDLHLVTCCGLSNFSLTSHHPSIISFSLTSDLLLDKCDDDDLPMNHFFKRHPLLQYLHFDYCNHIPAYDGIPEVNEEDLPHLQVLSITRESMVIAPTLSVLTRRPLKALKISDVFSGSDLDNTLCHLDPGLQCFHIKFSSFTSGEQLHHLQTVVLPKALRNLNALEELKITYDTHVVYNTGADETREKPESHAGPPEESPEAEDEAEDENGRYKQYSGRELVELFDSMPQGSLPSLKAVTIEDRRVSPLNPTLLDDFPRKFPSLRYFGWNGRENARDRRILYEVVYHGDGKASARKVEPLWTPPNRDGRKLWIDENVYDRFGEVSYDW